MPNDARVPTLIVDEKEQYTVPSIDTGIIARRLRENAEQAMDWADNAIVWQVNHERFDIEMRYHLCL